MRVGIPSPLVSYTRTSEVDATGATFAELLADLDRRYPGFRFRVIDEQDRMRSHMRFFVNGQRVHAVARTGAPVDGVAGLRVNHGLSVHVARLTVTPR